LATGAVWAMSGGELADELLAVWSAEQTFAARRLALVRQLGVLDEARKQGATSLTAWLVGKLRITGSQARRMV
jgi:hypothetical protein